MASGANRQWTDKSKPTYSTYMSDSDFELSLSMDESSSSSNEASLPEITIYSSPRKAPLQGELQIQTPSKLPPSSSETLAEVPKTPENKTVSQSATEAQGSSLRTCTMSPGVISPLKLHDSLKRSVDEGKRLASKVRKITNRIKEKTEWHNKIDELMNRKGGIRTVSKEWEDQLAEETESDTQSPSLELSPSSLSSGALLRKGSLSNSELPSLPTKPPGKPILVNSPSLITELYPPGLDVQGNGLFSHLEQNLMQQSPEALREIICGDWLKLMYQHKPCPPSVWQWLFQIMSRSSDATLSSSAFKSLTELLQAAVRQNGLTSVCPPTLADILDVIVCLGAVQSMLLPRADSMDVDATDDVFEPPRVVMRNIASMVRYITAYLKLLPSWHSAEELESLVTLLLNLALDPPLCGQVVEKEFSQCIGAALSAIPEESWMKSANRLNLQAVRVSEHHHNRLHIAYLISGASERQRFLQKMFCQEAIANTLELKREESNKEPPTTSSEDTPHPMEVQVKTEGQTDSQEKPARGANHVSSQETHTGEPSTQTNPGSDGMVQETRLGSDCSFAQQVVLHYYHKDSKEFTYDLIYSMYSVLTLLSLFMQPSEMRWPSEQERMQFAQLLGALASAKVRDNSMKPELAPVKDLIIRMSLEVSSHKVTGPQQTDLFAFVRSEV